MTERVISHGATQFAALSKKIGAAELGRRLDISEGMVRHLATARKTPSAAMKDRIESTFGIERASWMVPAAPGVEEKVTPAVTRSTARVERERQAGQSAIARLEASVEEYNRVIDDARLDDPPPTLAQIAGAMAKRDAVLVDLAKLYGEGDLTAAAIHRSRVWNDEIWPKILAILQKHPEAARDFAEAFAQPR